MGKFSKTDQLLISAIKKSIDDAMNLILWDKTPRKKRKERVSPFFVSLSVKEDIDREIIISNGAVMGITKKTKSNEKCQRRTEDWRLSKRV